MPKKKEEVDSIKDEAGAAARAEVFDALHQEMELAEYGRGRAGRKARRILRNEEPSRAAKLKELEEADVADMAIEAEDDYEEDVTGGGGVKRRKRLRGPRVAFDDSVLKSMPLMTQKNSSKNSQEHNDRDEMLQDVAALGIDLDPDEVVFENDDDDDDMEDDASYLDDGDGSEDDNEDEGEAKTSAQPSSGGKERVKVSKTGLIKPAKRVMHRLKDFTSQSLAQKHGEAIGAHVMGMSETAVQKLREVAKIAPGAPQVYSSLGMVYESMLTDVEGRYNGQPKGHDLVLGESDHLNLLQKRLELAQKAYASYHVASLLCKRDFVLWERSGDAAQKVAQIYYEIINQFAMDSSAVSLQAVSTSDSTSPSFDPNDSPEKWQSTRKLWLEHALSAYQASDNLRPPGLDIPCKLAELHMSLGNYIDALSILTDLRNKANETASDSIKGSKRKLERSEMEGSYPCWLLYADLMMKIGYECKQHNDGTSSNQNYLFKRWLRKHSKSFDWKERRLQALCLALESAAGSVSTMKLIKWMKKRAKNFQDENEDENDNDAEEANGDTTGKDEDVSPSEKANTVEKEKSCQQKTSYDQEREKLLNIHKVELSNFDRISKEMNLVVNSPIYKDRVASRVALVEKHRVAMKNLAMRNFAQNHKRDENKKEPDSSEEEPTKALPLQASCCTVYDIASLLLRQCINLRLYDGGLLVVQSVLNYFNERVLRYERKMKLQRENALLESAGNGLVQPGFKYDRINLDSEDSDEECLVSFISDDEDLEQPSVMQSLKRGTLPIDIKAMHAICLLGVGGQDYIAFNHIEHVIESEELDSFTNTSINRNMTNTNPQWRSFAKCFDSPIDVPYLLSSVADLVTEDVRSKPQSHRALRIFRKYLKLDKSKGLDQVLFSLKEMEKVETLKILLATLKLLVGCAKMNLATLDSSDVIAIERAIADSIFALKIMTRFHHILWHPRFSDWSLPKASIDLIAVYQGAVSILASAASLLEDRSLLDSEVLVGFEHARCLMSTICYADNAAPKRTADSSIETWQSLPISSNWQNIFHEKISLRAHNLCAACCVSSFSGWEPSEFNLDQLRNNSELNFFGVSLEGPTVAGFLSQNIVSIVEDQWYNIAIILPDLEALKFDCRLDERKRMSWYINVMKNLEKQGIDASKISCNGEEDGIRALLSFSSLCLIIAQESEEGEKNEFVKLAMSVLLPITQFCIDKEVWQSTIGKAVITGKNETKIGYYLDENCHYHGPIKTKQGKIQYPNKTPTSRNPRPPRSDKAVQKRYQRITTDIVKVPASALLKEWTKVVEQKFTLEAAKRAMKKVDDAMKNLRISRTLNSLERASIDVSVALLSLVVYDECNNPFVCMQQAAMFAALGSKRGNNDEPFKQFLPLKSICSPSEALNILGRADCLRAIHFLQEAQYLCTWVASVCKMHREQLEEGLSWNSRWKVVSIITYVVSATIDETGEALSLNDSNAGELRKWDESAKEEFRRGESDALALVNMNPSQTEYARFPANGRAMLADSNTVGVSQMPSLGAPTGVNGINDQFQNEQPYAYYEETLIDQESQNRDIEEDNPFAGVEVVGI